MGTEKQRPAPKNCSLKKKLKKAVLYLLIVAALGVGIEYVCAKMGWKVNALGVVIVGAVKFAWSYIEGILSSVDKDDQKKAHPVRRICGLKKRANEELKNRAMAVFLVPIFIYGVGPLAFAYTHMGAKTFLALRDVSDTLIEGFDADLKNEDEVVAGAEAEESFRLEQALLNEQAEQTNENSFLKNPYRFEELSSRDWTRILFHNQVGMMRTEEEIRQHIQALENKNLLNGLTEGIPEVEKDRIQKASALEANMISSDDLDQIISLRQEVLAKHQSAKLHDLLAENFNRYALEYLEYYRDDGQSLPLEVRNTVLYYYGQSILSLMEELQFEDANKTHCLKRIRMRYQDMLSLFETQEINAVRNDLERLAEIFGDLI